MIDIYAGFLYNMEKYGTPVAPDTYGLDTEADLEADFEAELIYAMSQPVSDETSFEKLNRLYPHWGTLLPGNHNDI